MPSKSAKRKQVERDPVAALHQQLMTLGYITSDRALMAQCHSLEQFARMTRSAVPAMFLQGPPGVGKTFLGETMCNYWKADEFIIFQFTPGVTREDLMFDLDIANIALAQAGKWEGIFRPEDTVRPGKFAQALLASLKGRVVLLLDELDKASDKVDAFLLDYLNSCRMDAGPLGQIVGNPQNLMVFITANNQRQITEPLMRRCFSHALAWPTPETETQMIKDLANKQLNRLGRPTRLELQAIAKVLVALANEVRGFSQQLKKVPSSPEMASALVQVGILPESDWGTAVYEWLLRYESDRKVAASIWKVTPNDIRGRIGAAISRAKADKERERVQRESPPQSQAVRLASDLQRYLDVNNPSPY